MPDGALVQIMCEKLNRTELLLIFRSCGLKLKGNQDKLSFATEILRDFRAYCTARTSVSVAMLRQQLRERYDKAFSVLWNARVKYTDDSKEYRRERRAEKRQTKLDSGKAFDDKIEAEWPVEISEEVCIASCKDYYYASQLKKPRTCACCVRSKYDIPIEFSRFLEDSDGTINWDILRLTDSYLVARCGADFAHPTYRPLDGLMVAHSLIVFDEIVGPLVPLCLSCHEALTKGKVPKFSMRNDNYRGRLPEDLRDITWLEEKICARYCTTANVIRLFQHSSPDLESEPYILQGNTCAFELNTVSTASVLPRTPADVNGMLAIICVGPGAVTKDNLKGFFRVRKAKVMALLRYLVANHCDYSHMIISEENASLYEDDDVPPGLLHHVTHDKRKDVMSVFRNEAAGLQPHPAELFLEESAGTETLDGPFIEPTGVIDPDGHNIAGRMYTASALRNLFRNTGRGENTFGNSVPLLLARGGNPVNEYRNPQLFPGMFPTLFPLGRGGFESPLRSDAISFQTQANYFFDIADRSFCRHSMYTFVALNHIQHRLQHLNTYFTVRRSNFDDVARDLSGMDKAMIDSVATHLEKEKSTSGLTDDQKKVFGLLSKVNTIASRVPGSEAAKIQARNRGYAMSGFFGISEIFMTINCDPLYAPLFQVMFGDESVDLTDRYPVMPSKMIRARRIALDPVAAADFFQFSIRIFFEHLLGWDFETQHSTVRGGLLGHLRAFFGTVESTKRMRLHGHFLVWLRGGLNPNELHQRLELSDEFKARYFRFWDGIIKHHLPDFEYVIPKDVHPGMQRPPLPGGEDWNETFIQEVKLCGEEFQRHPMPPKKCKPVCHLYGNEGVCRFGFPHDIVQESHYDAATHSIVRKCLDPWVNYCNYYMLVMCRHNHDIKSILSGKAAKAAIYYVTDYMTKGDLRTHEVLTMLSKAVAKIPDSESDSVRDRAKKILHTCVSQFQREQQISGQQAARHIRGLGDVIASHETVPMLSSAIMARVRRPPDEIGRGTTLKQPVNNKPGGVDDQFEEDLSDAEEVYEPVIVSMTDEGCCAGATQIDDYWYRDVLLSAMVFYDFVRFVRKEKRKKCEDSSATQRLGTAHRYCLRFPHPQHATHELIRHNDPDRLVIGKQLVPRPVGCTVPRATSNTYALFVLSHFAPCGMGIDKFSLDSIDETFRTYAFSPEHRKIMENWECLHECEDERDAERMRKRMSKAKASQVMTAILQGGLEDLDGNAIDLDPLDLVTNGTIQRQDAKALDILRQLTHAGYFESVDRPSLDLGICDRVQSIPIANVKQLKVWDQQVKEQEGVSLQTRRAAADPTLNVGSGAVKATVRLDDATVILNKADPKPDAPVPETVPLYHDSLGPLETAENLINRISIEMSLNERQDVAFRIVATYFVSIHAHRMSGVPLPQDFKPLRMLLTGPGGTGKTWVVKALKKVMAAYSCGHRIRTLAPTGSAAALIDGMTVHKGLGLSIEKRKNGKGNRDLGDSMQNYSLVMSPRKSQELRAEWKDVWITVVDEISLLSCENMCDLDQSLQYAIEEKDWFGGMGFIAAGDFLQHPPVGGSALYSPIRSRVQQSNREVKRRLGRMAYKTIDTVIELVEQQRMKGDPEFGHTMQRLRMRRCTPEDVGLFNSRVIRSATKPDGIDMSAETNVDAVAIVNTNLLREAINSRKAMAETDSIGSPSLVMSAAVDMVDGKPVVGPLKDTLMKLNSNGIGDNTLPGVIPFYEGMPVILKCRNISTELKITNGGQGIIRKIEHNADSDGYTTVHCIIVELPLSTVKLCGLPEGWYPVRPSKCKFSVKVADGEHELPTTIRVSRQQLPIQPAFAVTGHSAQGKTLLAVLLDMRGGGFHAYVGASRPTSREGLFLTHSIALPDLNAPLPADILVETRRLDALAHNTLVRYGFSDLPLVEVRDPEGEDHRLYTENAPKVAWPTEDELQGKKRKRPPAASHPSSLELTSAKRRRLVAQTRSEPMIPRAPFVGCKWDPNDYSCAYDVFFMAFVCICARSDSSWRQAFAQGGPFASCVADILEQISPPGTPEAAYSAARDNLRDFVSDKWPQDFIRHGSVFASADLLFEKLRSELPLSHVESLFKCDRCGNVQLSPDTMGTHMYDALWRRRAPQLGLNVGAASASIQTWQKVMMSSRRPQAPCICGASRDSWSLTRSGVLLSDPPQWLCFSCEDVFMYGSPLPSPSVTLPRTDETPPAEYRLRSIIYLGESHYTSRLFLNDGTIWTYDGRGATNGVPAFEMLLLPRGEFPSHLIDSSACVGIVRLLSSIPASPNIEGGRLYLHTHATPQHVPTYHRCPTPPAVYKIASPTCLHPIQRSCHRNIVGRLHTMRVSSPIHKPSQNHSTPLSHAPLSHQQRPQRSSLIMFIQWELSSADRMTSRCCVDFIHDRPTLPHSLPHQLTNEGATITW